MPKQGDRVRIKAFKVQKSTKVTSINALRQKEEERRKQDEEETAKVYKDFIAEFSETSKIPLIDNVPSNSLKNTNKPSSTDILPSSQTLIGAANSQKDKKKSNLESFKEELEMEQKKRELRENILKGNIPGVDPSTLLSLASIPTSEYSTETSDSDPNSTCVYVGGLPYNITEKEVADILLDYGPIGTIRIVKSQRHEEDKRDKCCAFVTFMCRLDAESAIKELREKEISNMKLNFGWAKPSSFPSQPGFLSLNYTNQQIPQSSLPFSAYTLNIENYTGNLSSTYVYVTFPTDWALMQTINRFCEFLIREGPMFEAMMMNREMHNPFFRFLFDPYLAEHVYYRWRLFSLLQGDTQYRWCEKEFRMFKGGSIWVPPKMPIAYRDILKPKIPICIPSEPSVSSTVTTEPSISEDKKPSDRSILTDKQRESFTHLLRHVTPERIKVAEIMVWAIDHSECAKEIVEYLTDSLCISTTPISTKIGRLYVLSDILFNSSVDKPNAAAFRRHIEKNLKPIFIHFNDILKKCDSKIYSEKFKKYVISCFNTWHGWLTYAPTYLTELQNIFLGISNYDSSDEDVDGVPLTNQELIKLEKPSSNPDNPITISHDNDTEEDIDGVPLGPEELELLLKVKTS